MGGKEVQDVKNVLSSTISDEKVRSGKQVQHPQSDFESDFVG